ncbi:efflux transporter outer membrane subunit [Dyella soli]|uniref:Efflux transporter outer membrane subunit n=1 Tax=Dyella soli TaxID=522319 RepID=A0A4R0YTN6_9GAMM|nr:efflux transporter outer membrane subunit [Dyella soli]TCI09630.1 efflux transporter outer membrane subunit [Dyella soli]
MTAAAFAVVTLAGCAFAPPARSPASPSPGSYTAEPMPASSKEADGVAQHFDQGAAAVPDWWRLYGSDTLDAWVAEGLSNSPSLESARHTLEAVRQQYRAQVGSTMLPSIDANGLASRQRTLGLPNVGPTTTLYNVYAGQLSLSYTFDFFGAARFGVKRAAAQVDLQRYELETARRTLAANIVVTAINASALAEQVRTTERLTVLAHEQASLTEKAYQAGAASHDDVLAAQQNAASVDALLPPLEIQAQRARHTLATLMGRTPDQAPTALPLSQFHLPSDVPVSIPSDLLQQRPDVLAAEAAVQAASAQVGVATANMFPHISLSASLGSAAFNTASLFTGAGAIWGAGVSLAQPLFHGGALKAQRKEAMANYDAAVAQYRQTVLNAFQNVADSMVALNQDASTLRASQTASTAAEQSFADTHARYQLGAVAYPVTVDSEQRMQNARLAVTQAAASRLVDTAALFQAMGTPPGAEQSDKPYQASR